MYFSVDYCRPPAPNPTHLGCYRSELALQHDIQDSLVDWVVGRGSSERWFGFSNSVPANYTWDLTAPQNGPSFQMHGGGGMPALKSLHPNLNLQVDMTGCSNVANRTCPRWTMSVQAGDGAGGYQHTYDLGAVAFGAWENWVLQARFSPDPARGYLAIWRNGQVTLPRTVIATAYNDTVPPYLKFGVYRGDWKEQNGHSPTARWSAISYGGMRVGDENSSFSEVSTAQRRQGL